MSKAMWGGLARAVMAAFGGWLVNRGLVTEEGAAEIVGAGAEFLAGLLAVAAAGAWSWWSKRGGAHGGVDEKGKEGGKGAEGAEG